MAKSKWEYGKAYQNHNMEGDIHLPNQSVVRVCDITQDFPPFMLRADTVFVDTPGGPSPYKSYYTKAGLEPTVDYTGFEKRLFERIGEIGPKHLFVEAFRKNAGSVLARCRALYNNVEMYEGKFYGNKKNVALYFYATNGPITEKYKALEGMDDLDAMKWICFNHPYEVIADPCMGQGGIGRFAFQAGKTFVGTELNYKRLAVLVEYIKNKTNDSL